MKLHKMIEMYLKYANMHTIGTINAFICINNHVNSCIKCMLSNTSVITTSKKNIIDIDCKNDKIILSLLNEHVKIGGV